MDRIARDLTRLKSHGLNVLLITSGAIGLGRRARIADGESIPENESKSITEKQRDATIGQPILYDLWWDKFRIEHKQETKEFLVVNDDFLVNERKYELLGRYQDCLHYGIIPIINEHDAKSLVEIETEFKGEKVFRDNDGLASLHAKMLKEAGYNPLLILLSNTDGIYTPESFSNGKYEPVRIIKNANGLENGVSPESSSRGRGGVISKIEVGKELANLGITTVVANGQYCNHEWGVEKEAQFGVEYDVLDSIIQGKVVGTRFLRH
jgi:glutamate 5-kinase